MACKCTNHGSDTTSAVAMPTRLVHVAIARDAQRRCSGRVDTCGDNLSRRAAHLERTRLDARLGVGEFSRQDAQADPRDLFGEALLVLKGGRRPHDRASLGRGTRAVMCHQFRVVRDAVL
eukprot:scaffold79564_cov78-Phaeocystis_antarctica.AAC.1